MARHTTPSERRILGIEDRLQRLIGEGPVALFRDARRLAKDDGFGLETRAALVWHNAREIESAIHKALRPVAPFDGAANKAEIRAAQVEAIIKELELPDGDPAIVWWKEARLYGLSHRPNLGPPRPFTPADWDSFVAALELILGAFEARYHRMIDHLDALLTKRPADVGPEIKAILCVAPPTGEATLLQHFFERADYRWLAVLPGCILDYPPGRLYVIDPPGAYRFPVWHASRYLAKIAPDRPRPVYERVMAILAMAPENPWIHIDVCHAAAHFDAVMMATWAQVETTWLNAQTRFDWNVARDFAMAVSRLGAVGLPEAAFDMAQAVLALRDEPSSQRGEPSLRTSDHEYEQALDAIVPALTSIDAKRTATFLADLLDLANKQARPESGRWSMMWRSSIADDGTNDSRHTIDKLTDALRDVLGSAATDPEALADLRALLAGRAPLASLFARLDLYLVTIGMSVNSSQAKAAAMDPATYVTDSWIEAHRLVEAVGPILDADEIDATIAVVRSSSLDESQKDELADVLEAVRAGEAPTPIVGTPWFKAYPYVPPPSPVSAEQIGKWSLARTVRYLKEWKLDTAKHRDGDMLEFAFQEAVKANPTRWSGAGAKVVGLPPEFLLRYIMGLRETAKDGAILNANALVALCEAGLVIDRAWLNEEYADVRKSVAWLFRDALNVDQVRLSSGAPRTALWVVIEALLADDSPPTVHSTRGGEDDLPMESLNHTQSIATSLVIVYSLWLKRLRPRTKRLPLEARLLLEARLDPAETSRTVRFTIGEQLTVLWWLDPAWMEAGALAKILSMDPAQAPLREAAWRGYLWHGRVPLDMFQTLVPVYHQAASGLDPSADATDSTERLAAHILLLARIGTIGPETDDGLLTLFFQRASAALARKAIHELGWGLYNAREQTADPDEIARLRLVWEWLSAEVTADRVNPAALGPFDWWFASGRFDLDWSLDQVEHLANTHIEFDFLHVMFERLSAVVTTDPARIGRVTEAVVSHERREIELRADDLRPLVRALLAEPAGSDANKSGGAIVSIMLSRGITNFPGA